MLNGLVAAARGEQASTRRIHSIALQAFCFLLSAVAVITAQVDVGEVRPHGRSSAVPGEVSVWVRLLQEGLGSLGRHEAAFSLTVGWERA